MRACVCPCTSCALSVLHCNISAGKDIGALLSNIGSAAASAPAAGSGGAGTSGAAPAQEEEKKEEKAAEPESESDEDMGFGGSTWHVSSVGCSLFWTHRRVTSLLTHKIILCNVTLVWETCAPPPPPPSYLYLPYLPTLFVRSTLIAATQG